MDGRARRGETFGTAITGRRSGGPPAVRAPSPPPPPQPTHTAQFFGPFQVVVDGHRVTDAAWRRHSARTLLKWLLLAPGEPFAAVRLSSLLWPTANPQRAAKNLSVALHCLRHLLEPHLRPRQPSTFIRSDGHRNYWFDLAGRWRTDVEDAWDLLDAAHEAESSRRDTRAIELYEHLAAIHRRSFLPEDIYDDLFAQHRHEHEMAYARAVERLMCLYLVTGQLPNALSSALTVLADDPCDRSATTTIVEVHRRQGNVTAAIRQLDELARNTERELGVPLDDELLLLRTTLLQVG